MAPEETVLEFLKEKHAGAHWAVGVVEKTGTGVGFTYMVTIPVAKPHILEAETV